MSRKINVDVNGKAFYYTGDGKIAYPAGAWKRFFVRILDFMIALLPSIIFAIVYATAYYSDDFSALFNPSANWSFILSEILAVIMPIIAFIVIPILNDGQTLMKKAFSIQPMFMDNQKIWKGVLLRESLVTLVAIMSSLIILISGVDYLTAFSDYSRLINESANAVQKLSIGDNGFNAYYDDLNGDNAAAALGLTSMDQYLTEMYNWYNLPSTNADLYLTAEEKKSFEILVEINSYSGFGNGLIFWNADGVLILNSDYDSISEFVQGGWNDLITAKNAANVDYISKNSMNSSMASLVFQWIQRVWLLMLFIAVGVSKGKVGIHDALGKTIIVDLNKMYLPTTENVGDNPNESKLKPVKKEVVFPTVKPTSKSDVSLTDEERRNFDSQKEDKVVSSNNKEEKNKDSNTKTNVKKDSSKENKAASKTAVKNTKKDDVKNTGKDTSATTSKKSDSSSESKKLKVSTKKVETKENKETKDKDSSEKNKTTKQTVSKVDTKDKKVAKKSTTKKIESSKESASNKEKSK